MAFKLGFASLMASMPFIVTRLMGKTESYVANVAFVSVPGFIISFIIINRLIKSVSKVLLYKICLLCFAVVLPFLFFLGRVPLPIDAGVAGLTLIALLSFPMAGDMLLPKAILADVTDYDAQQTGHRREGMYFGIQGLIQKIATSVSKGICGALFGFIGFLIFRKYPLDDSPA